MKTTIIEEKVAQISNLHQETVIKFGNEILKLDLSVKILKLGLDLHYRQVTVAMQEDGRLVVAVGKMAYRDFLKWIKKKLAQTSEVNAFKKRNKVAQFIIGKGYEPESVWAILKENE